jgi:hypothetical protein
MKVRNYDVITNFRNYMTTLDMGRTALPENVLVGLFVYRWHTEAECSWVQQLEAPGSTSGIWVVYRDPDPSYSSSCEMAY